LDTTAPITASTTDRLIKSVRFLRSVVLGTVLLIGLLWLLVMCWLGTQALTFYLWTSSPDELGRAPAMFNGLYLRLILTAALVSVVLGLPFTFLLMAGKRLHRCLTENQLHRRDEAFQAVRHLMISLTSLLGGLVALVAAATIVDVIRMLR
jgi:hypothetical protein